MSLPPHKRGPQLPAELQQPLPPVDLVTEPPPEVRHEFPIYMSWVTLGKVVRKGKGNRRIFEADCVQCGRHFKNFRSAYKHCKAEEKKRRLAEQQAKLEAFFVISESEHPKTHRLTPSDQSDLPIPPARIAFIEFIVECHIALNTFTKTSWKTFSRKLVAEEGIPKDSQTIRADIVSYGNQLRDKMLHDIRGQVISLAIDGITHFRRTFYVVLAISEQRMYFLELLRVKKADHKTLSKALVPIVSELIGPDTRHPRTKISAVISDNAANLVRTLSMTEKIDTIQSLSGEKILHMRCGVHTSQLVLTDLESNEPVFVQFKRTLSSILTWMRTTYRDGSITWKLKGSIPTLQEIKWGTYSDAVRFIEANRSAIKTSIDQLDEPKRTQLEWTPDYDDIGKALILFGNYVNRIQGDGVTLAIVFQEFLRLKRQLKSLKSISDDSRANYFGERIKELLKDRFQKTMDGRLAELAFIFTRNGFQWFKRKYEDAMAMGLFVPSDQEMIRKQFHLSHWTTLKEKFIEIAEYLGYDYPEMMDDLDRYLHSKGTTSLNPFDYWAGYSVQGTRNSWLFARTVTLILRLPASEACCERAFSVFELLFPHLRLRTNLDLMKAEMTIRTDQLYRDGFKTSETEPLLSDDDEDGFLDGYSDYDPDEEESQDEEGIEAILAMSE